MKKKTTDTTVTTVEITTAFDHNPAMRSALLLEAVVAPRSTRAEKPLSGNRESLVRLEIALILIECLCEEILSPEALYLAIWRAKQRKPTTVDTDTYHRFLEAILEGANKARQKNVLSGMF